MKRVCSVLGVLALAVCANPDYDFVEVDRGTLARIDRGRAIVGSEEESRLAYVELQVPSLETWGYRMASPTSVVGVQAPTCRVLVNDPVDRALHAFDYDGIYRGSINIADAPSVGTDGYATYRLGRVDLYSRTNGWFTAIPPSDASTQEADAYIIARRNRLDDVTNGVDLGDYELAVAADSVLSASLNEGMTVTLGDSTFVSQGTWTAGSFILSTEQRGISWLVFSRPRCTSECRPLAGIYGPAVGSR